MGIIMSSLWCSNHGCWISMNDMKENGQIFCVSEQLQDSFLSLRCIFSLSYQLF